MWECGFGDGLFAFILPFRRIGELIFECSYFSVRNLLLLLHYYFILCYGHAVTIANIFNGSVIRLSKLVFDGY